jgi:hypothetical protein
MQLVTLLTRESVAALAGARPPCLSLYQPTHRSHPRNSQDPIRFRNLVDGLAQSLHERCSGAEAAGLLEPFHALAGNAPFWNHSLDGLAVFSADGLFRVFRTQRPVAELAVVADSFHSKPLWRILQTTDRYQVLGLTRHAIRLFEGNRDVLDEVDLAAGVPRTLTDALGEELTDPRMTVGAYGGSGPGPMYHGHGGKKDEVDLDAERFFRVVDRAVLEHHSRPSGLPLILAALPEHHALFHEVSKNPLLLADGIGINPEALSIEELRDRAWQLFEPGYRARLAALADAFRLARSRGLGSDDLAEVAAAAPTGRIETLLLESDRQISGRLDASTGRIVPGDLSNPWVDDLLDDLGELVSGRGGQVLVVPAEEMPSHTGLAAVYRY